MINPKKPTKKHIIIKLLKYREDTESSKKKEIHHIQESINRIIYQFLFRNLSSGMIYIKCWKKKIVNQEFYIWQNHPLKKWEIETFLDKKKLREFVITRPALWKTRKESFRLKWKDAINNSKSREDIKISSKPKYTASYKR